MAVVDSLEVQIQSKSDAVNVSLNELIKKMGLIAEGISAIGNNRGLDDFAKRAQEAVKGFSSIQNAAKGLSSSIAPEVQKASKSLGEITAKYKDLGKGFKFTGSTAAIQKQIESYSNALEKAKLKKEELEVAGKTDGQMYEYAVKDVLKYENVLAGLKNQLAEMQTAQPQLNINIHGIEEAGQKIQEVAEQIRTVSIPESALNYDAGAMASVFGEAAGNIENWTQAVEQFGKRAGRIFNESAQLNINIHGAEEAGQQLDTLSGQWQNMANLFTKTFADLKSGALWEYLTNGAQNYVKNAQLAAGIKVHTDDYKNVLKDIERTEGALDKLQQKQRDMQAGGTSEESKEWQKVASEISAAQSRLDSYINKRNEMRSSGTDTQFSSGLANGSALKSMGAVAGEAMSSLWQRIGEIGGAVSQAVGNIPIIGRIAKETAFLGQKAFGGFKFAVSGLASAAQKAVSGLSKVASTVAKLASGIKGAISKFSSLAKSMIGIKSANKGMNTSLKGGFKTLLRYGIGIESVFTLINKLRTAAKEGFGNLALFSPEVNASISSLTSSLAALKNSLAVAFAPILNVVAPYISAFIDMLTKAFNAVGRLFAALTGKSFASQAIKNYSDYAASVSGAGKATKEAGKDVQKGIRAFDELKTISINKDEGENDGAGGGGEISPADMFETVPIEDNISDFAQKLKDAWAAADFTEIGAMLGTKLNTALDSINWEPIKVAASKVGKSIGTLISGFVEVDGLGDTIGRTIGEAINTGLAGINSFLDNTHWDSVGQFIGNGLNGIVNTVDWEGIGHFFAEKWNAVFEVLGNIATTFDWSEFGLQLATSVNTFITDFDWIGNGAQLGELIKGLLDSIISFLENTNWQELGNNVADFIGAIDWTGIMERLAEGIGAALGGLAAFLWGLIEEAWSSVVEWWNEVAFEDGQFTILGLLNGIWEGIKNIGQWIYEHIFQPFIDGFKAAFGIHSPSTVMAEMGNFLMEGLLGGITALIDTVVNAIQIVWDGIKGVFDGFMQFFKGVFTGNWRAAWDGVKQIFSSVWNGIKGIASIAVNAVSGIIGTAWNGIRNVTSTVWNGIKTFVSGLWNGLKSNVSNVFGGIKTTITNIWEGIKTVTTNVWNGIKNAIKTPINAIIGFINGMVSGVVSGMNGMINALNRLSFDVPDWVPLIGGKTFGFNIGNISAPQIPYLAKGAVFRGGEPFLAVVNDQKRGQTNIEAPLKTIQEAVRIELDKFSANSRMAMPDTSMYSYRPMTAPEIGYAGAYGNYQHDMSAYMPGGYNSGGSGLLGMTEEQTYNMFYQAMKTAIHNEQSRIGEKPIQLVVNLDGDEVFNKVYDINQKNASHFSRAFVMEDYKGYHEPAPWIWQRMS